MNSEKHDSGVGPSPLAMTTEEFRAASALAAELATAHVDGLTKRPVYKPMSAAERHKLIDMPFPHEGQSAEAVMRFFAEQIMPFDMGNQRPTFAAWVNPAAAPIAMFLDFLASVMNSTAAKGNHAATCVEECVVRWMRDIVGFPDTAEGVLVDGGSLANLHGLAAALQSACDSDGWDLRVNGLHGAPHQYVAYTSSEVHNCVRKSSRLLGLGEPRSISVDERLKLDMKALTVAVARDRAAGHRPFCVVASAGTVNTGIVDPLSELADFCAKEKLWLHVDGAYGGFGLLDPRVAPLYAGIERADSVALDPHKWLAVPNTCSVILVRHAGALRAAFGFEAPYLNFFESTEDGFGTGKRFDVMGVYQTRRFLAAKLLAVLLQLGQKGLREHVERHITLARRMTEIIDADPELEVFKEGDLSIVCFRYVPAALRGDDARLDQLNGEIMEKIQIGGRSFISGTELHGRFVLRSCALHYNLMEKDIDEIVDDVRCVGRALFAREGAVV